MLMTSRFRAPTSDPTQNPAIEMVPEDEHRLLQDHETHEHDDLARADPNTASCCNVITPAASRSETLRSLLRYASGRHSTYRVLLVLLLLILISGGYLILTPNAAGHGWQVPIATGPSMTTVAAQCGRTPPEALLHGCKFDTLSFSWLPPACHDEVLAQEFLGRGNWTWFRTPYPRQGSRDAVPTRLVAEGAQGDLFVSKRLRAAHCEFQWRKLQRFVDGTGAAAVDDHLSSQQLLLDCTRHAAISGGGSVLDKDFDMVSVKYPTCVLK